jgi:hypothetical protein
MRKFLISLVGVCAIFAMTAGLASSATKSRHAAHASVVRCGGLYQPPCKKPVVISRSIVACQQTGTTISFPITLHANAGLRSATVRVDGKKIVSKKFPGNPTDASFRVSVKTKGFKSGLHTLSTKATDSRGKSATKSVHFTICKPKPVFTG